jgi:hypothetical protein
MKRHRLMIRSWLTMAVTAASLVPASSAAAMLNANDAGGPVVAPQAPVTTTTPQGFDWTNLAIVVAVAVVVLIAAYAVAQGVRNRSRLAPSH